MLLASTAAVSLNQLDSTDLDYSVPDELLLEIEEDPAFAPVTDENDEPIAAQIEDENALAQEDKKVQEEFEKEQAAAAEADKKA